MAPTEQKKKSWSRLISDEELGKLVKEHVKKGSGLKLGAPDRAMGKGISSVTRAFKRERIEEIKPRTWFEKYCALFNRFGISPPDFLEKNLADKIDLAAMHATPKGVFSLSLFACLIALFIIVPLALIFGGSTLSLLILPFAIFYYLITYPEYRAAIVSLEVQNSMLLASLYMAIYLRLNPTMEGAVEFASKYVSGVLGDDLKKALWDIEIKKYATMEASLGAYCGRWAKWDENFVKTIDMLRSSLQEKDDEKRAEILSRGLDVQLDSTHMRMRKYANALTNPVRLLFTMFVMLPLMILAVIPIAGIFLSGQISALLLIMIFNVFLPLLTFYYSVRTLSKRPGSFPINIARHPLLPRKGHFFFLGMELPALPIAVLAGLLISLYGLTNMGTVLFYKPAAGADIFNYVEAMVMSWSLVVGAGVSFALYFYLSSFQAVAIRNEIRGIEGDFRGGLRELGIMLSQNLPIESAIDGVVADYRRFNLENSSMYRFFVQIVETMKGSGATFREALFNKEFGVIRNFPSVIIEDVMAAVAESVDRGPKQVSLACLTISKYLDKIADINNTVYSLLAETVSSISLLTAFVIPLVGAVAASTGMLLTRFLAAIGQRLLELASIFGSTFGAQFSFGEILPINLNDVISPPLLQLIVGFYVLEMILILAILRDGIENGFDETTRNMHIATQLAAGTAIYSLLLFTAIFLLNMIAGSIV